MFVGSSSQEFGTVDQAVLISFGVELDSISGELNSLSDLSERNVEMSDELDLEWHLVFGGGGVPFVFGQCGQSCAADKGEAYKLRHFEGLWD